MAKNVWLKDYKIGIAKPKALTAKEAKMVAVTISRGLWNTENSVIRNDASVLRHDLVDDLVEVTELTDDLRSRVVDIVKRFNRLREEDLNKTLLDDSLLPMGGDGSDATSPTAPPNNGGKTVEERITALENSSAKHEKNLEALNGATGITEGADGAWVPIPDGQFDRNSRVQQHLGYNRADDGTVTFNDRPNTRQQPTQTRLALIVMAVCLVLGYLIVGAIAGWVSIPAIVGVPVVSLVAAGVTLLATNHDN